jgi:hypothetical protein
MRGRRTAPNPPHLLQMRRAPAEHIPRVRAPGGRAVSAATENRGSRVAEDPSVATAPGLDDVDRLSAGGCVTHRPMTSDGRVRRAR